MRGTQIRERLHSGQRIYGTHVASLMNPNAASIALKMELDFAFFCTEHMPLDRTEIGWLCRFYANAGISPIVRVPSPDPHAISMALDAGAEGIVVPYVEEVSEVRAAIGAVHYRPIKGRKLQRLLNGTEAPDAETEAFLRGFNRDHYLIIGVESVAAIDNLEALLSQPGVDGVFLGPHDLTTSMGIPEAYDHPDYLSAVEEVIRTCRRYQVGVGLHTQLLKLGETTLRRFLNAGLNWIINGADIVVMRDAMNEQLRNLRALAGDDVSAPPDIHAPEVATCLT